MTNPQTAELAEPCIGSFYDPAALVAPQFPTIAVSPFLVVGSIGGYQFDASPLPSLAQGTGVIPAIGDYPLWFLPRPAFGSGDAGFHERGVRKVTSAGEALSSRTPNGIP